MLSLILGFVTGLAGPIASIASKISDLQLAKVQATTNTEKMKIDQQIEEAHDRRMVLIAEAGNRLNSYMRFFIALGPASLLFKVTFWDKVMGSLVGCTNPTIASQCYAFRTDPSDPQIWTVLIAVIAFYFAYDLAARSRK